MLALEMGGNNPLVVWDVSDIDAAVHHAIMSAFISAGQRCTCARRLVVADTVEGDAFIERLVEVASTLTVGPSNAEPQPFMGPVVSSAVAARLVQAQADMAAKGGKVLLQMKQLDPNAGFVTAGIVDVTNAAGIADEEWFGPLLQIIRVSDFDSAIQVANNSYPDGGWDWCGKILIPPMANFNITVDWNAAQTLASGNSVVRFFMVGGLYRSVK